MENDYAEFLGKKKVELTRKYGKRLCRYHQLEPRKIQQKNGKIMAK